MITIEIVKLPDGQWMGRSFSDRWNLETLKEMGAKESLQLDVAKVLTKGQMDRLRRTLKARGFALRVKTASSPLIHMSEHEELAMARPFSSLSARVRRLMRAS